MLAVARTHTHTHLLRANATWRTFCLADRLRRRLASGAPQESRSEESKGVEAARNNRRANCVSANNEHTAANLLAGRIELLSDAPLIWTSPFRLDISPKCVRVCALIIVLRLGWRETRSRPPLLGCAMQLPLSRRDETMINCCRF